MKCDVTSIRVMHCPWTIGGNPGQLARAERALGLASVCVAFEESPFAYAVDEVLWDELDGTVRREVKRLQLLGRAARDFDLVHFNFGSSLMPRPAIPPDGGPRIRAPLRAAYRTYVHLVEFRDLPFLRRMGKAIVVTYQGGDARQGDVCRQRYDLSLGCVPGYYTQEHDEAVRRGIAAFTGYADRIFALNPDLLAVLPDRAEFLPYAHVDPAEWSPSPCELGGLLHVVHAPTHRGAKGTEYVVDAVEQLQADRVPIELELVEGLTHGEARNVYQQADVVVDQLLAGWYGGLAVEAMALAKPVVAYLREEDFGCLPEAMREELPVISATPETVADVLRRLATTDRHLLRDVGLRGRAYVERWHDPRAIATRLKGVYEEIVGRAQSGSERLAAERSA